jgi:PAS domain-containing protein
MQILSIRVAPEFDAAGKVFGGVGIIEDRTAFLEAEEQLRDTRERYVLAQRGTNEGLWDWDPEDPSSLSLGSPAVPSGLAQRYLAHHWGRVAQADPPG